MRLVELDALVDPQDILKASLLEELPEEGVACAVLKREVGVQKEEIVQRPGGLFFFQYFEDLINCNCF